MAAGPPRRRRGLTSAAFAALVVVALALAPGQAQARERTYTIRSGPITLGGFATTFPARAIRTPRHGGFIVGMRTRLVDARGRALPIARAMLHHVVFVNRGPPGGPPKRGSCADRSGEPFFGTGEEDQRLLLPPGYGYRIGARDRWRTVAMYMSHVGTVQTFYLQYTVTISDAKDLQTVKPLWLRANGCDPLSSYTVPGGGPPGSVDVRTQRWKMPISGRIVAAGAHLHGGAKSLQISQPRCGDRTLIDHRPLWGNPGDAVYRVRPILHEPSPIATSYFLSATGVQIRRGDVLNVTARYDAEVPHPRVMAITHVYVAPQRDVGRRRGEVRACAPLPADRHMVWTRSDGRAEVAPTQIPLTGLDASGAPVDIAHAAGPLVFGGLDTSVDLEDSLFEPANLSIPRGGRVTWIFRDRAVHSVLSANAPRAVDSPMGARGSRYTQQFTVPGTYNLFCNLHPVTMHETVTVRP